MGYILSFNYRLIAINILIYVCIVKGNDIDKSSLTLRKSMGMSSPASSITDMGYIVTDNGLAQTKDYIDENGTAITSDNPVFVDKCMKLKGRRNIGYSSHQNRIITSQLIGLSSECSSAYKNRHPNGSSSSNSVASTLTTMSPLTTVSSKSSASFKKYLIPIIKPEELFTVDPTLPMITDSTNSPLSLVTPKGIVKNLNFTITNTSEALSSSSLSPLSTSHPQPSGVLDKKWQRILSRPKRYLSFPDGSSFTVSVCFTVGIIGNPRYNYMAYGLNWGVAYDLPNTSWVLNHLNGFASTPYPVEIVHRRTRRSFYNKIETIVENMGYNGRDCILRTLCESRQYFQRTKLSMIGEMLRVLFSLPKQRLFTRELNENSDLVFYDEAYRNGHKTNCSKRYSCSFSLLELAFGKYSTPPPTHYEQH